MKKGINILFHAVVVRGILISDLSYPQIKRTVSCFMLVNERKINFEILKYSS